MTPRQIHYAQIMIECGCSIEDVAVTMRVKLHDAIYAVAPALKANPAERKRVQKMVKSYRLDPSVIPAVHKGRAVVDLIESALVKLRTAA